MKFVSKIINALSPKIQKLEAQAYDILELPKDLKAFRVDDQVIIVDYNKNKIIKKFDDNFPANPARAAFEIVKKLKIATNKPQKEIWTCGFRDSENRWVWYKNSQPRLTVSFKELYPKANLDNLEDLEKKIEFCTAVFGTSIINKIKEEGIHKTAKDLNALKLENPYTEIKCNHCNSKDNYTIDDLVDENKTAKYDSNHVICTNCNQLIKLA